MVALNTEGIHLDDKGLRVLEYKTDGYIDRRKK